MSLDRYKNIVGDYDAFESSGSAPLPTTIWHNRSACTKETFLSWIGGQLRPLEWYNGAYQVETIVKDRYFSAYLAGLFHVQEEVSLIPVKLLKVQPGWNILDLCAAPGNKTAQVSIRVGSTGTVVANDINRSRLGVVQTTLDRLSLSNVVVTNIDGGDYPDTGFDFDAVLADVPCSCEGTMRKNRRVRLRTNKKYRATLVNRQRRILERALTLCKPGGYVVYSTCTYAPEENEGVVSHVLANTMAGCGVELIPAEIPGLKSVPGISDWQGKTFHRDIGHSLRIWPHLQDSGGFYAALFRKPENAGSLHSAKPATTGEQVARHGEWPDSDSKWFRMRESLSGRFASLRLSGKYDSVVNAHVGLPALPPVISAGVRAINTRGTTPRLSTAGAQLFGKYATRQKINLTLTEVRRYMAGNHVPLNPVGNVRPGRVIVSVDDICIGLGTLIKPDGATGRAVLDSLFPKTYAGVDVRAVMKSTGFRITSE